LTSAESEYDAVFVTAGLSGSKLLRGREEPDYYKMFEKQAFLIKFDDEAPFGIKTALKDAHQGGITWAPTNDRTNSSKIYLYCEKKEEVSPSQRRNSNEKCLSKEEDKCVRKFLDKNFEIPNKDQLASFKDDKFPALVSKAVSNIDVTAFHQYRACLRKSLNDNHAEPTINRLLSAEYYPAKSELYKTITHLKQGLQTIGYRFNASSQTMDKIFNAPLEHVPRTEHYWNRVFHNYETPTFYLGDAAGATEYQKGYSISRGFRAVDFIRMNLTNNVKFDNDVFGQIGNKYQRYWKHVVDEDFMASYSDAKRSQRNNAKYFSQRPDEVIDTPIAWTNISM